MSTSISGIRKTMDELRAKILSFKQSKAVIDVIDVFRDAPHIVQALRSALREEVKASELEDLTGYLTEYVSLNIIHATVTQSELKTCLQDTARKVGCTVMIVNPKRVSHETKSIMTIKEITGHFPRCALLTIGESEIIMEARNTLNKHGITDIYEVPKPDPKHKLSDKEQMQWLSLLHGCLEEGDKTSTTDDQKKICTNPKYGSTVSELPQKIEAAQGPPGGQTLSQEPKETIDHPLLDDESSKLQGDVASGSMDQHSEEESHTLPVLPYDTCRDLSADGLTGPEFPHKIEAPQGPSAGQTMTQKPKAIFDQRLIDDKSSKPQGDVASGSMEQHSEKVSHQITADLDGTYEDLSADGKKVHWDFLTECPQELTLQDDEVVISCGIRFSPSGAKLTKPIKVTLDHNAHFNNPRRAEIIFYTRNKDSETFERIPAFTDGSYPRCDVRAKDLDLDVDHFSIWWIVAKVNEYFFGKRVNCTPYVDPSVLKGDAHLVDLRIFDDLPEVVEKIDKEMEGYKRLHPPQPMIVEHNRCDINIELFEGLAGNEKKICEEKKSSKDIIRLDRTTISFQVNQPELGVGQKFLKFTLDQEKSSCSPTLIKFQLRYDADVTTTTAAGAELGTMPASSQAARVSTSAPLGQMTREKVEQVEPDGKGYYKQKMKKAKPSEQQLDLEKNYKMDALTKGHMFILNMSEDREGSDVDVKNIKHVFKEIGYEIETHSDLTAEKLTDMLEKFAKSPCHEGMCSAVFFFMGHGTKTGIECTDGEVTYDDICNKVSETKYMNGKPKIIFFQSCRGIQHEERIETDQAATKPEIPAKSDVFIVYATTAGNVAYRDREEGTWFVQMLCEEFLENAHDSDLSTMLEQVTRKIGKIVFEKKEWGDKKFGQSPVVVKQGISKKIYFLPKYCSKESIVQQNGAGSGRNCALF